MKMSFMLDTVVNIKIYGKDEKTANALIGEAFEICAWYESLFSRKIEGSDVYRINSAGSEAVSVDPETAALIELSLKYRELSGGAFDITVGGLSDIWDFKSEHAAPPADADIKKALSHIGAGIFVDLGNNTVTLSDPEARLDLGAVAKGYIADRIADYLRERGVSAIIDLGGNIVSTGRKPGGSKWLIGIQKPFAQDGELIAAIKTGETSVVTSGSYQRYFYYNDKLYHHIFDTATGWPAESGLTSVTVISASSAEGDALSTALFCMGLERGLELAGSLPGIEAVFVTEMGAVFYTSGLEDVIVLYAGQR